MADRKHGEPAFVAFRCMVALRTVAVALLRVRLPGGREPVFGNVGKLYVAPIDRTRPFLARAPAWLALYKERSCGRVKKARRGAPGCFWAPAGLPYAAASPPRARAPPRPFTSHRAIVYQPSSDSFFTTVGEIFSIINSETLRGSDVVGARCAVEVCSKCHR